MKRKLLFITSLLLIGNAAYAADNAAPAAKTSTETTEAAKPSETTSAPAEKDADTAKVAVPKLNEGASGRAIGNLLANKPKPSANANADAKKRVEELEELAEKQKKLLELYKKQNK